MGQQNTSVLEYRFKFTVPIALILVRALQRNRTKGLCTGRDLLLEIGLHDYKG